MNENKELPIIFHSKKSITSMCLTALPIELIQGVLSILIFFFYEAELGLSSLLAGMGILIYAVYDAFNDPLVGWLTDRPFKFTKKWGRRFPFVVIFFLPMLLCFLLIFSPPAAMQSSEMGLFGWLVFSTCLFDTIESFFTVNYWSITPDKYRDQGERRTVSQFEVYLGFIGVILSFLIPPMIISFGDISSYALMAWICVAISTVTYKAGSSWEATIAAGAWEAGIKYKIYGEESLSLHIPYSEVVIETVDGEQIINMEHEVIKVTDA